MKKTLSLLLVLAMLCTALLGVTSFAAEESTEPQLEITQANLKFEETVYLLVAVNYTSAYSTLADAQANVTLKITNDATGEVYNLSADSSVVLSGHVCFTLTELGAKNMGDQLSIQAYNKGVASSKSATYSILEYALKARGTSGDSFDAVLDAMLAYGAAAREVYNHAPEANSYDLTKKWSCVVVGGSVEGKKIVESGSELTFTPNTAKTGANAKLYDMSLNEVTSIPVGVTSTRLVYIGDAQKTTLNLNADTFTATGVIKMNDNTSGTEANASNLTGYFYTNKTNTGSISDMGGARNKLSFTTGAASAGEKAGFEIVTTDNGRKAIEWNISRTSAVKCASFVPSGTKFNKDDAFTVSIELGSTDTLVPSGYRLRGKANGTYDWSVKASGDGWNILAQDGTVLTHVGKYTDFTLHIVFDLGTQTMTYYTDNGSAVYTQAMPTDNYNNATDGQTAPYIDWTYYVSKNFKYSKTYLYKFVAYYGNIFE